MNIRAASLDDIEFLVSLENSSFSTTRRSNRKAIRHSLESIHQEVFILTDKGIEIGAMILLLHKNIIRIYSIAVLSAGKHKGAGSMLIKHAIDFAKASGIYKISLEADMHQDKLIKWYENFGFEADRVIVDYYAPNEDAMKMVLNLSPVEHNRMLVVIDYDTDFFDAMDNITVIKAITYIEDENYQRLKNAKVFNLCRSLSYQSVGYYVSLLALARNHSVFPNVISLRDAKSNLIIKSIGEEISEQIQEALSGETDKSIILDSYFGDCNRPEYQGLIKSLNLLYEAPLIRYNLVKKGKWYLQAINTIKLEEVIKTSAAIGPTFADGLKVSAQKYFSTRTFIGSAMHHYEYDLAILIDPDEENAPSCKIALNKFKVAAKHFGIYVEFITKKDYKRIPEFDALFIRTTTNVNDYTYDFSRYAYAEGLIVIDDPWSILRCSNKLYLYEALKGAGLKMPKTFAVKKSNRLAATAKFKYPIILKQPDSAFSLGVVKAENQADCLEKLNLLLKKSELVVAQEFLPSEYDWRIGVLDKKPIFACKYYMAKGHWQIYNWNEVQGCQEGDSETLPIENVPKRILNAAVKAANVMGDGLYGVDLKEIGSEVLIIEVNDNPNIDFGIEDAYLGDALYETVMGSFYTRLENARKVIRKISY